MFLLVANKYIDNKCIDLCQGNGEITRVLSTDCFIYEELEGFLKQFGGKTTGAAKGKVQCYCSDEFEVDRIENLHPAFHQMVHISDLSQLRRWLSEQRGSFVTCGDKDWNMQLANVWKNIYAPSRPSPSEIDCYKKYFEKVRINARGSTPSVLILGSTIEFRKLAHEFEFDTFIVDYNIDYYNEISRGLPKSIIEKEQLIVCDWSDMKNHPDLHDGQFDIIIGDLAIGNIPPFKLKDAFEGIFKLLRQNGFFLGKNLYSFSRDQISEETVHNIITRYFEISDQDSMQLAYAMTMYHLSIYATQERRDNLVNFDQIHNIVKTICISFGKESSALYEVYCGENTSFKDRMKLSFYTYSIHEIIRMLQEKLYFVSTEYGKDVYSDKFPLLIFTKKPQKVRFDLQVEKYKYLQKIKSFVIRHCHNMGYVKEWAKYISAQYFIVKLSEIFTEMRDNHRWQSSFETIKMGIISSVNIKISEDLTCYIESYDDKIIARETRNIENVDELDKDKDKLIGETYTLAILVYLSSTLGNNQTNSSSVFNLAAEKLFGMSSPGEIWQPEEAPWVRAKVCLALKNLYIQLPSKYIEQIDDTLYWIVNNYNEEVGEWPCEVGSKTDTKALCCEVLLLYYPIVPDDKIKSLIIRIVYRILEEYVYNGKIYETCALYPIESDVFDAILADEELHGKPFGRKLITRIEFLSILLRMIAFAKNYAEEFKENGFIIHSDMYSREQKFLAKRLSDFWERFERSEEKTIKKMTETEFSGVLQIVYSLAEAFRC